MNSVKQYIDKDEGRKWMMMKLKARKSGSVWTRPDPPLFDPDAEKVEIERNKTRAYQEE